ncbi:hypothetical protein [Variovorax sp. 160MFSha2.1]|uniref:hypothetical protein n=1 Tax=Variovorax sp. 160MFSha2.1 TaxID=3158367 RepID=UPI003AAF8136
MSAAQSKPRFAMTYCSQCGSELGPGDSGVSHCSDHRRAAQHTPGPWVAHADLLVRTEDGWVIARCCSTLGKYELEEPNVRLIAAAPELLAAAQRVEPFVAGFDDDNLHDDIKGMLRDLRAAVAKATGSMS